MEEANRHCSVCVSITLEQRDFIANQRRKFKLSRFVQAKLDDYMKLLSENEQFIEREDENEKTIE